METINLEEAIIVVSEISHVVKPANANIGCEVVMKNGRCVLLYKETMDGFKNKLNKIIHQ